MAGCRAKRSENLWLRHTSKVCTSYNCLYIYSCRQAEHQSPGAGSIFLHEVQFVVTHLSYFFKAVTYRLKKTCKASPLKRILYTLLKTFKGSQFDFGYFHARKEFSNGENTMLLSNDLISIEAQDAKQAREKLTHPWNWVEMCPYSTVWCH